MGAAGLLVLGIALASAFRAGRSRRPELARGEPEHRGIDAPVPTAAPPTPSFIPLPQRDLVPRCSRSGWTSVEANTLGVSVCYPSDAVSVSIAPEGDGTELRLDSTVHVTNDAERNVPLFSLRMRATRRGLLGVVLGDSLSSGRFPDGTLAGFRPETTSFYERSQRTTIAGRDAFVFGFGLEGSQTQRYVIGDGPSRTVMIDASFVRDGWGAPPDWPEQRQRDTLDQMTASITLRVPSTDDSPRHATDVRNDEAEASLVRAAASTPLRDAPFWTAMMGSFSSREGAAAHAERVRLSGIEGTVLNSTEWEGLTPGYWVVYSGAFPDRDSAMARVNLAKAYGLESYVRFSGVKRR